jgi:stringent starvation protein B
MALKDLRPYLLNAYILWLDESGAMPHIVIRNIEGVRFPKHLADSPVLAFNVSGEALQNLVIDEEGISFTARFNGVATIVYAPYAAITKLYSADKQVSMNLQGEAPIAQPVVQQVNPQAIVPTAPPAPPKPMKPVLTVIQGDKQGDGVPKAKLSLVIE